MNPYRWTCHVCSSPNKSGAPRCDACGFPAVASALDIERELRARADSLKPAASQASKLAQAAPGARADVGPPNYTAASHLGIWHFCPNCRTRLGEQERGSSCTRCGAMLDIGPGQSGVGDEVVAESGSKSVLQNFRRQEKIAVILTMLSLLLMVGGAGTLIAWNGRHAHDVTLWLCGFGLLFAVTGASATRSYDVLWLATLSSLGSLVIAGIWFMSVFMQVFSHQTVGR